MSSFSTGSFLLKLYPMGDNLVLLEDAEDDKDFEGFVEEVKHWLYQWFKLMSPWKPTDVDK